MNSVSLAAVVGFAAVLGMGAASPDVAYPDGFRHWTHVKSATINPASPAFAHFGGIHHIYANAAAMKGYAAKTFPDGSVLVFDVHEWKDGGQSSEAGARRIVDVMVKDRKRFADTGGWGFTEFKGDIHAERSVGPNNPVAQCASCHTKHGRQDGVFSAFAE